MFKSELFSVNEIFGPTIQGEGFAAGQHCMFIRLFHCNLECTWCDTGKTWAVTPEKAAKHQSGKQWNIEEQNHLMNTSQVVKSLMLSWDIQTKPTLIVISGGEPLMQGKKLYALTRPLFDWGNRIHIETAGTIRPDTQLSATVEQWNVSPKLSHSGNAVTKRFKPDVLRSFIYTGKARFKFVMQGPEDFDEVDTIVQEMGIAPRFVQVMPEGNDAEKNIEIGKKLIEGALARGYGLSFRSHVLLWGDKEGV